MCGAVTSALIIIPFGLTALGLGRRRRPRRARTRGGSRSPRAGRRSGGERSARRWALVAGLLLGIAVLFRLDLALAVGLSAIALVRGMSRPRVNRLLAGFADRASRRTSIQLATAGVGNSVRGMVLDPVFHLRGGRGLPDPAAVVTRRRLPATGGACCNNSAGRSPHLRGVATTQPVVLPAARRRSSSRWCEGWRAVRADRDVAPSAHAPRRRRCSASASFPRRCNASTPRTSRG